MCLQSCHQFQVVLTPGFVKMSIVSTKYFVDPCMRSKVMFPLRSRVREWTLVIADEFYGAFGFLIVIGIVQNLLLIILFEKCHISRAHLSTHFIWIVHGD